MARARVVRLVRRNPGETGAGELPYGEWIPAHAVKFNEDGTASLMTEPAHNRGRRRNIAAGFWQEDDEGYQVFHPIRASYDYSRSRAGEPPLRRGKAKAKKKAGKRRKR